MEADRKPIAVFKIFVALAAALACTAGRADAQSAGTTILPTDVAPLPGVTGPHPYSNDLQMRVWQYLPASMFYNASVETTFRLETNPFQYPLKRTTLKRSLPLGTDYAKLTKLDKEQIAQELSATAYADTVYRINPNVTVGWAPNSTNQFFVNYFLIRDNLMKRSSLDSTTEAVAVGAQHTINLSEKLSLQPQLMARELWQNHQAPTLDYLPGVTLQYNNTANLITYANGLLQLRFKDFVSGHMREIDPFYTVGMNYQRGRWQFAASTTFLQNFRKQFGAHALVPENNYSFISDFELDRQIFERIPGLVALVRAEPVWNFHSHATPGLAGMDFRLYYGFRMAAAKPPLNSTMDLLRKRYMGGVPTSTADLLSIRRSIENQL